MSFLSDFVFLYEPRSGADCFVEVSDFATYVFDAEGFIGIRSLRYLAHWCDVVRVEPESAEFRRVCLGTGA